MEEVTPVTIDLGDGTTAQAWRRTFTTELILTEEDLKAALLQVKAAMDSNPAPTSDRQIR